MPATAEKTRSVETRVSQASDAPAIRALIDCYVASGTLLPRTEEFIVLNARDFLVATSGDEIVGCVHLDEYSPSLAELRSLAVAPDWQGAGVGRKLVAATERLAGVRNHDTLFAVSNDADFFAKYGFARRHIPELDLERSEVSRFKGVYAKDVPPIR